MEKIFTTEHTIGYYGTNYDLEVSPVNLTVYLQDLAVDHSNSLGYTLEVLGKEQKGWIITNWHIDINRYPKYGDKIKITTWANSLKRMQAERSFKIESSSGDILCTAVSRWIFIDLIKRRPVGLLKSMEEAYLSSLPPAIENERYIMPKSEEENLISKRQFVVTRRDTDTNSHTNNTKYIEWAIDEVPDEIYLKYKPVDIKVVYRKECYKNSNVVSKCYIKNHNGHIEINSFFLDALNEKVVFAEVSTVWR